MLLRTVNCQRTCSGQQREQITCLTPSATPHPGPHPHTLLQVAVALAYALPSLSLSFGFSPSRGDLDAAAALVEPALGTLRPWEVALLLWGAARLDYHPGAGIMQVCVAVERWECAAGRL